MNTPPLLVGVTLLVWGVQCGFVLPAALMAVVLESARVVQVRWDFADKDLARLWDLCALIFVGAALYAFGANDGLGATRDLFGSPRIAEQTRFISQTSQASRAFSQWLPMMFFPFMAAVAYGTRSVVPWTAISWVARHRARTGKAAAGTGVPGGGVAVAMPYFGVCLASATVAQANQAWFYVAGCGLVGWALWGERSRRFALATWVLMLALAGGAGYLGNLGLEHLRAVAQGYYPEWISRWIRPGFDARKSRTAIGQIGRLKGSGRIVWRVTPGLDAAPPLLLRETSYRFYKSPAWYGLGAEDDFALVRSEPDESTWSLFRELRAPAVDARVNVAGYLPNGRGLLPLPPGTRQLERLPVFLLKTNHLGAVLVEAGPRLVGFDAVYGGERGIDTPPTPEDLQVPEREAPALGPIVGELALTDRAPARALETLERFFGRHFEYRSWLAIGGRRSDTNQTPLGVFLTTVRAGHCEYFATATVLLLRAAGIPARYAVGWSVQEKSGRTWLVRERHAHAWCLAWIDGAWRDVDTTPASWLEVEGQQRSAFEALADAWARLWFEFNRLRYGQSGLRAYLWWIMVPVLLVSVVQLLRRRRRGSRRTGGPPAGVRTAWPGHDSDFYRLERALGQRGLQRAEGETPSAWQRRLARAEGSSRDAPAWDAVVRLHYRYRFDPAGLEAADRAALRVEVDRVLRTLERAR